MFRLKLGTNTSTKTVVMRLDATPKQALAESSITYDRGIIYFEGNTLNTGDLNKSFAELGVTEGSDATLNVVIKQDNA